MSCLSREDPALRLLIGEGLEGRLHSQQGLTQPYQDVTNLLSGL